MSAAARRAGGGLGLVLLLLALAAVPAAAQALAAAVLPASRSVQVGAPATAFATILNAGPGAATGCSIAPATAVAADLLYQRTDALTNDLVGEANVPADIPAGGGQSFLLAFTPTAPFAPTDVALTLGCDGGAPAPLIPGVNTLLLSASVDPVPDIVAVAATAPPGQGQPPDGVVRIPSASGLAAFAVAAVNAGATGTLAVAADTGGATLPLAILLCETVPGTGECVDFFPAPAVEDLEMATGGVRTFSVFVKASGDVAFDPAGHRVHVRFRQGTATRGATSVAVQTPPRPPDLTGNHSVSGSLTLNGCSGALVDGTFPVTGALTVTSQHDTGPDQASVGGAASLSLGPGRLLVVPTWSGTVSAAGVFHSDFALAGFFPLGTAGAGTGVFPGSGTFQGQASGGTLPMTMTGTFQGQPGCQVQGALTAALAPAP